MGKNVKATTENLVEGGLDALYEIIGSAVIDNTVEKIAEFMGIDMHENTKANNIAKGEVYKVAAAYFSLKGNAKCASLARAASRVAGRDVMNIFGVSDDKIDEFWNGLLQVDVIKENMPALMAQEAEILNASEQSGDSFTFEEDEADVVFEAILDVAAEAKGRMAPVNDDIKDTEAYLRLLASSDGKTPGLEPISAKHPLYCRAKGCGKKIVKPEDAYAVFDSVSEAGSVFCLDHKDALGIQNAEYAAVTSGDTPSNKSASAMPSGDELKALIEEYKGIVGELINAQDDAEKAEKKAKLAEKFFEKKDIEAKEVRDAVEAGAMSPDSSIVKGVNEVMDRAMERVNEATANWTSAQEALENVEAKHVEFSKQHELYFFELKEMSENGSTDDALKLTPKNVKADTWKVQRDGGKIVRDPYPMLGKDDTCLCQPGHAKKKLYKNCCGGTAWVNPKNGKTRKPRSGDVRYTEYFADAK